jgi:hypothetical protein
MTILNFVIDNTTIIFSILAGSALIIGISSFTHLVDSIIEENQTVEWENSSETSSLIDSDRASEADSTTSDETVTPATVNNKTPTIDQTVTDVNTEPIDSPEQIDNWVASLPPIPDHVEITEISDIHESKFEEIQELYKEVIEEYYLTDVFVRNVVYSFDASKLELENINELILETLTWWG